MKHIPCILFLMFIFTVISSCSEKITSSAKIVLEQPAGTDLEQVNALLDSIADRAKHADLDIKAVLVDTITGNITIQFQGKADSAALAMLCTKNIHLNFFNVYPYDEIIPILGVLNLNSLPLPNTAFMGDKADSLFYFLRFDIRQFIDPAAMGYAQPADTAFVIAVLDTFFSHHIDDEQIELMWGVAEEDHQMQIPLYALRKDVGNVFQQDKQFVVKAHEQINPVLGRNEIGFRFADPYVDDWAAMTRNSVNQHIAVVVNGVVYSAPRVTEEISGGGCTITGNFTPEEAKVLANVLTSVRLPFDAKIKSVEIKN